MSLTRSQTTGKPTFGKLVQVDGDIGARKKRRGGIACFEVAILCSGEHHVADTHSGPALGKGKQGSACPDLDVIGMGTDRKDGQGPVWRELKMQRQHSR